MATNEDVMRCPLVIEAAQHLRCLTAMECATTGDAALAILLRKMADCPDAVWQGLRQSVTIWYNEWVGRAERDWENAWKSIPLPDPNATVTAVFDTAPLYPGLEQLVGL